VRLFLIGHLISFVNSILGYLPTDWKASSSAWTCSFELRAGILRLFRPRQSTTIPAAMNRITSRLFTAAVIFLATVSGVQAASDPTVTIEKPKARTTTGGACRIVSDGTLSGVWGPSSLPTLAFTIGPGSAMADAMHANKGRYTGPGKYPNVIIAVYLGKTALDDTYAGLGTVALSPDGHTGSFALNNGSASGHFDCGQPPKRD
jgi:hypothetical protein